MCITSDEFLKVIFPGLQALAVVATAVLAFFRFGVEGSLHPRIQFDVTCDFWKQKEHYLVSISITAENKGFIEHKFKNIGFEIRGIERDKTLREWETHEPMVDFDKLLKKVANIIPPKTVYYFVRPGVCQTFHYAVLIPADIKFIKIKTIFAYKKGGDDHSAQKIFEVKETKPA
jgi:hypothetical protein